MDIQFIPNKKHVKWTPFVVDAFSYGPLNGIKGYFLRYVLLSPRHVIIMNSHFHSDHYTGLTKKFNYGPIFCGKITAHLIDLVLHVPKEYIHVLPMEQPILLWKNNHIVLPGALPLYDHTNCDKSTTITVTLLPANHCPGSVMFIFSIRNDDGSSKTILHTGDFRCDDSIIYHHLLKPYQKTTGSTTLDLVYLDTTYDDPAWCFPSQHIILAKSCQYLKRIILQENKRKLAPFNYLVVIGCYTIGKERIAIHLADAFSCKIYCQPFKRKIFNCYTESEWGNLFSVLEDNPLKAMIHLVPMDWLQETKLSELLTMYKTTFTHIVAIYPTGWTSSKKTKKNGSDDIFPFTKISTLNFHTLDSQGGQLIKKDRIFLYELPYSEHSSYEELERFRDSFLVEKIIPTV